MAKLNYYTDDRGNEYIAIISRPDYAKELKEDGLKLIESHEIIGDVHSYPTDRLLIQE